MYIDAFKDKMEDFLKGQGYKTKDLGERYELLIPNIMLREYKLTRNLIEKGIVDGGRDEGIDSIYIIVNGIIVTSQEEVDSLLSSDTKIRIKIFQTKTSPQFEEDVVNNLYDGITFLLNQNHIFENKKILKVAQLFRYTYKKWYKLPRRDEMIFEITYASFSSSNKHIINNKYFLEKEKKIVSLLDDNGIKFERINYMGCKEVDNKMGKMTTYTKELNYIKSMKLKKSNKKSEFGFICMLKAKDYYSFITNEEGEIEDHIFEENIRDFKGAEEPVNKSIIDTLKSGEVENFWCYNNGITIIAEGGINIEDNNSISLTNYQVINGCQTSYSIDYFVKSSQDNEELDFELIVKVIVINSDKEDEILKIIKSTNSQTSIENYAFESYRNVHKRIEEYLKTKPIKYYYERRPGYYRKRDLPIDNILEPVDLLQEMHSIIGGAPSRARSAKTDIFESFKDTYFKDEINPDIYYVCHEIKSKVDGLIMDDKRAYDPTDKLIRDKLSLHISRMVFSLLVGKEFKFISSITDKKLNKKFGTKIVDITDGKNISIENEFDVSVKLLRIIIESKKNQKTVDSFIKTSEFDKKIEMILIEYINKKMSIEELRDKFGIKESNDEIQKEYSDFNKELCNIDKKFSKIHLDGDMRYDIYSRIGDLIFLVNYYYTLQDKSNIVDNLKEIQLKFQNGSNTRDNRKNISKEVCDKINILKENIKEYMN